MRAGRATSGFSPKVPSPPQNPEPRKARHRFHASVSLLLFFMAIGAVCAGEKQSRNSSPFPSLDGGPESYAKPVEEALKGLARAIGAFQGGQYGAAMEFLPGEEAARRTSLGDYFLYYRGRSNLALERTSEALDSFRALQRSFPSSSLLSDSLYNESQALLKLHNAQSARAVLANPSLPRNAQTFFWQARAEEEARENGKAVELYLRIYTDFATAPQSAQAQERLQVLAPKSISGSAGYRTLLQRADTLLAAGMNKEARLLLSKLSRAAAPDRSAADRRLVLLGAAETNLGKAATVLPYLSKVGNSDPALHAHALYLISTCRRRLKNETAFLQTRDEAVRLYPESPYTERILYSIATYYDVADRSAEARNAYQRLADSFPKGPNAERALWKIALYDYIDKNYEAAWSGFWKYLQAYPTPRSAGAPLFWMGRSCERRGDSAGAALLYRRAAAISKIGYYGRLSAQAESALSRTESGRQPTTLNFQMVAQAVDTIQPSDASIPNPSGVAEQVIERAHQLIFAGLSDLAQSELRWGIRQYPQEKALSLCLSQLYASRDEYDMVFTTLRRAFPDYDARAIEEFPEELWRMLFPFEHWSVVSSQSQKSNVDPNLVLGLIRQESAFNENARSRANARGLMQILPSTGRTLAKQSGVRYTSTRLYRPETNIILGIQHLAAMLRQFGGREELALAAYNAGDSRVEQWMSRFGDVDLAEFVERIPFAETRSYVKQVLTNKAYYAALKPVLSDSTELGKPREREQPRTTPTRTAAKK
jgi:soluble lytic murein transglycosylase